MLTFINILMGLCVMTSSLFAEIGSDLDTRLSNLYVFRAKNKEGVVPNPERMIFILGFDRHNSSKSIKDVFFDKKKKLTIYISTRGDLKPAKTISFIFGGKNEYAVSFDDDKDSIVGVVGEAARRKDIQVYAGLRDDPSFADFEAYFGLRKSPCSPQNGLRCDVSDAPVNSFGESSIGVVAVELPVFLLTNNDNPNVGVLKAWAKYYVAE